MAKTVDDVTERLNAACRDVAVLLPILEGLMLEPSGSGPRTGVIGRSVPSSREPWERQAATVYWDAYFGARALARTMRASVGLNLPLFDDAYGADALGIVRDVAPAVPDPVLRQAVRVIEGWATRARRIDAIDEAEAWSPVPVVAGLEHPRCPYCKTYGLRMRRRRGEVRCFYPECRDADGHPTRARMEPGRMTGEACLVFDDGSTLHFRSEGD